MLIKIFLSVILLILMIFFSNELLADAQQEEENIKEQTRLLNIETTKELETIEVTPPKKGEAITFRYGGWLSSIYRNYRNTDNDKSTVDTTRSSLWNDARLWSKVTFFEKYSLYVRLKNSYITRTTAEGYTGIGDDYDGPHLDAGYLKLDFDEVEIPTTVTFGRQYIYIGRAIAYGETHDGIKITAQPSKFFIKSFLTMTQPTEDNVDLSVPNYEKHGERVFAGTELTYLGIPRSVIYLYGLIQEDRTDVNTETQDYNYNSRYFGLGLEGGIGKNYGYWAEIIKQTGRSFTDADAVTLEKKDIDAWALDLGFKYYFKNKFRPRLEFEYGYGSGDRDRSKVNYTRGGGNKYGEDENFLYFGSFYGGYAFSPRLSNLNVWKLESSIKPFAGFKFGKDITFGGKYWLYRKDKAAGGIYDTDATQIDKDIGQEVNLYLYWNITKKIYWSLRYGVFLPGDAYHENTQANTEYIYTRLALTF